MKIDDLYENELNNNLEKKIGGLKLYTGTTLSDGFHEWMFRTKSKDTFLPIHNTISSISKEKLGINIRALFFCAFDSDMARVYTNQDEISDDPVSRLRIITPQGENFRLFQSKSFRDMTTAIEVGVDNIVAFCVSVLKRMGLGPFFNTFAKYAADLLRNHYHKNYTDSFESFVGDFIQNFLSFVEQYEEQLIKKGIEFDKDMFTKYMENMKNKKINLISKYIDSIFEIDTKDNIKIFNEVMLYAPEGFIIS